MKRIWCKESGFIYTMTLGLSLAFLLAFLLIMTVIGVSVARYALWNYDEAGNALKYAVFAATLNGKASGQALIAPNEVQPYFEYAFEQVTGATCTSIPGKCSGGYEKNPVRIKSLDLKQPGNSLPNGVIVEQPGYVVSLEVPFFPNGLFGHEIQGFTIPMTVFVVSQPVRVGQ